MARDIGLTPEERARRLDEAYEWEQRASGAVEPVALFENLIGGPALKPIGGLVEKGVAKFLGPKTKNRLYSDYIGDPEHVLGSKGLPQYAGRNVFNKAELRDIQESGFMRPTNAIPTFRRQKADKYFTATDTPTQHLRVPTDKVPVGRAVKLKNVEIRDKATGDYVPLKGADLDKMGYAKGGTVRGAGCAKRGVKKCKMR